MRFFGGTRSGPQDPDNPLLTEFLSIAAGLSSEEAARVEEAAIRTGYVSSTDLKFAIAMIVNAGMVLKINAARKRAQKAGSHAITSVPGLMDHVMLAYASGVMAETFVVRDAVDPKTWAFATAPWRTIFEIPRQYEGEEPETVAEARKARAIVEEDLRTRG